jgi:formylmethanofuran dehydrogenase subunit C
MRNVQTHLEKSALDLLARAEDCCDAAKTQHETADKQHEIAARQHASADRQQEIAAEQHANAEKQNKIAEQQHDNADKQSDKADALDVIADRLDALGHSLTADAVEVRGAADTLGNRTVR